MHGGAMAICGSSDAKNFKHVLFNNEAHDSVGAQPTASPNINFVDWALSVGYKRAISVSTE